MPLEADTNCSDLAGGRHLVRLCPQEIPCGLEAVTASRDAELGVTVGLVGVLTIQLLELVGQEVLGVARAGATVGTRGLLAIAIASRIQSRSLVTRA